MKTRRRFRSGGLPQIHNLASRSSERARGYKQKPTMQADTADARYLAFSPDERNFHALIASRRLSFHELEKGDWS
jgi:hypothetical protein